MEMSWETRPLSIHKARDWQNGTSSTSIPNSSSFLSKRRSTAAHVPPPGPPPSQPIPNLPLSQYDAFDGGSASSNGGYDHLQNGSYSPTHPYTRPTASSNLTAVTAFSQARHATYTSSTASSSTENLSDSPPRSMLRSAPRSPAPTHEIIPDRLLLSPPEPRSAEPRPSSRRALTRALELAREAVQLDSTNDDPYGAVVAYGKSVALLSEVMERVMRGEDSTESHRRRNGRRRSVVAQEEEVRRLKSIHDTYADRMNILSLIYSIPLPESSPPSTYASSSWSTSSASTQPSSPTSSSPTSESSDHLPPRSSSSPSASHADGVRASSETTRIDASDAIFTLDEIASTSLSPRTPMAPSTHPYASAPPIMSAPVSGTNNRLSIATPPRPQVGRSRASSTLPPPAPLPTTSPPPAPAISAETQTTQAFRPLDVPGRVRGPSVSHRRAGSGSQLGALNEENERLDGEYVDTSTPEKSSVTRSRSVLRESKRESHPLPPLPSPTSLESTPTPRHPVGANSNPQSPVSPTAHPRGVSSTRSEASSKRDQTPLINSSTVMGTISQRRVKTSAPPSMMGTPSSPTESTGSLGSAGTGKLTASSLPAATVASLSIVARSRAASQPGRRPSLTTASSYPGPPQTASLVPRKPSVPSRLNPHAPPQITINTALLSPPLSKSIPAPLVPPPPIPHANIPTAPTSPLPPMAPPDPLRKPYHMMNLLRQTMTSKTGGYITRRLHVPQEVWSQGGAKLMSIPEKIRVVEVLSSALEEIQSFSVEYFGAGNVSSGMAFGIGSIGRKEAEMWALRLEEFSNVCDGVVGNFGKKLGVGEGFVTKKSSGVTSWGGRLTRQFDKLTNGKNLDSPAIYVQGLAKLFNQVQILDEHTKAVSGQPVAALYAAFPADVRAGLELKLRRASEFFAKVVLTFVIRDMALLLDKYVKKCEKWLAE